MRGYTSLFSHILGSHPEIKGYSEMHQSYRSTFDLIQLRYKSKIITAKSAIPKYLFDKVLHNQYKLSKRIIKRKNVVPIIMIRRPEPTIRSVIHMGEKMTKVVSWYKDEGKVAEYYQSRLEKLVEIAKQANGKALYLPGENLIKQSDETLAWLTRELQLQTPLTKEYDIFSLTGKMAAGDPSENIKKGTIIENRKEHKDIQLSLDLMKNLDSFYARINEQLISTCRTI